MWAGRSQRTPHTHTHTRSHALSKKREADACQSRSVPFRPVPSRSVPLSPAQSRSVPLHRIALSPAGRSCRAVPLRQLGGGPVPAAQSTRSHLTKLQVPGALSTSAPQEGQAFQPMARASRCSSRSSGARRSGGSACSRQWSHKSMKGKHWDYGDFLRTIIEGQALRTGIKDRH